MKTFILMTKLSPEESKQVKKRAKLGRAWLDQVKQKCPEVKFIAHYALLGPYDFSTFTRLLTSKPPPRSRLSVWLMELSRPRAG